MSLSQNTTKEQNNRLKRDIERKNVQGLGKRREKGLQYCKKKQRRRFQENDEQKRKA